ncbi:hypothetical protein FA10DRAFT_264788 [Acaromyces ingoldii]|uniref:Uncharacterized protein n=1 Tax=Acaromyces ingoldii TaxID=215250 RepID=A0A316YZY0_9BASI|nr:hypothetical protein FA10DRAFT_264788 [Acaromyces ingoldii]PWN94228.1 hypothetical protein FA10DRAFT_264788 [Acaromyces ingoldii]
MDRVAMGLTARSTSSPTKTQSRKREKRREHVSKSIQRRERKEWIRQRCAGMHKRTEKRPTAIEQTLSSRHGRVGRGKE